MNFCSIEEAWGDCKISTEYQHYMTSGRENCSVEKFENVVEEKPKPKITYESKQENHMQESRHNRQFRDKCMDYIAHIKGCQSCYNAIRNDMKPSVTDNIQTLLHDNKDMIVLVLMGMFILLFFSLVNNITKN
jgi:hypothetical protein